MAIRIERCVCHNRSFAELLDFAQRVDAKTLPVLQRRAAEQDLEFGETCGLCHPYIRAMLVDGRVVFDEILNAHDEGD